jgi:SAM-dependent methyltransferase
MSSTNDLFDLTEEYTRMLNQGIQLSGENQTFFINGRLRDLRETLAAWVPRRILDFGCGLGLGSATLAQVFPAAEVVGIDTAEKAIRFAQREHGSSRVRFQTLEEFSEEDAFDLAYCNGVFHHIPPTERMRAAALVRRSLKPGGWFALFENNPWNPGTRMVMARIPFDRDAIPLSPLETARLLREAGFEITRSLRFLFYFPKPLAFLRFAEPWLTSLPLGAQYYALARKSVP